MTQILNFFTNRVRFDRNELSGAFGDIGTTLPLLIGMTAVSGMDAGRVFLVFGIMQVMTGIIYGIPMAVQPLKAVAMMVIAQKLSGGIITGAGLSIGILMLVLSISGALGKIGKIIPEPVIRGMQLGLGVNLAMTGLKDYCMSSGVPGYVLAVLCFIIGIILLGNKKYPPALFLVSVGIIYALFFPVPANIQMAPMIPFAVPKINDMIAGFILLGLPQIPLSIGNSILATEKVISDNFPEKKVSVKRIGLTYSLMNIISSLTGGVPVCHGAGGISGHYNFGARTGGSVIICGVGIAAVGLFAGSKAAGIVHFFPAPLLGVILLFEAVALMGQVSGCANDKKKFSIMLLTGMCAASLPYGYLIGMIVGTCVHYLKNSETQVMIKAEIGD